MAKGLLIVVSGPSGTGKGTILSQVMKSGNYYYSVSATTRKPREGEVDGVNYSFLTRDEFEKLIGEDGFLEHAEYTGNYYGTPRKAVFDNLEAGRDVILEIEVQGAVKVHEKCPEAVMVFILPPSVEELRQRLIGRGTESPEVIEKRVAEAEGEIRHAYDYDYVIMNDDLDRAIKDFEEVVSAEKKSAERNTALIDGVLGK